MARGGFPGIPGGNMQQLMRQAQKMQQQMMKTQEELDAREYEGTAGGGAVSCKVSGKRQLLSLTIDKDAVETMNFVDFEKIKSAAPKWAGCFNHGRAD